MAAAAELEGPGELADIRAWLREATGCAGRRRSTAEIRAGLEEVFAA